MITPISQKQQREVRSATHKAIDLAEQYFAASFDYIAIDFDLSGRCAGMYQVRRGCSRIRFNPWLFAKYYCDNLKNTVVHEVAHYVVDCRYGHRKVKPHGAEWRQVMLTLGTEPQVRGDYDMQDIPQRHYHTYDYLCSCRTHSLTAIRHRRIQRQAAEYRCRYCSAVLRAAANTRL